MPDRIYLVLKRKKNYIIAGLVIKNGTFMPDKIFRIAAVLYDLLYQWSTLKKSTSQKRLETLLVLYLSLFSTVYFLFCVSALPYLSFNVIPCIFRFLLKECSWSQTSKAKSKDIFLRIWIYSQKMQQADCLMKSV